MSIVDVHNEWDPLEEVVIGSLTGARVPKGGRDLLAVEYADLGSADRIPSGPLPQWVIDQTNAELDEICSALMDLGIKVRRPEERDTSVTFGTPDWRTDGFYDYCPRDLLLTVGETVIEAPMVLRSRACETLAYKEMLIEFLQSGSRWISAPKPRLRDSMYAPEARGGKRLLNEEPAFDAANILRFGTDILYLLSDSGNELGARWLQSALGDIYTVHTCPGLYAFTHVDSTIVPLRPGLVLLNPARVNETNLPEFIKGWDQLWCPELVDTGFLGDRPHCSTWIGMNLLVIRPGLVMVDDRQINLIYALKAHRIEVLPMRLTHSRSLGGAFHCVSLDVRRSGRLETYR